MTFLSDVKDILSRLQAAREAGGLPVMQDGSPPRGDIPPQQQPILSPEQQYPTAMNAPTQQSSPPRPTLAQQATVPVDELGRQLEEQIISSSPEVREQQPKPWDLKRSEEHAKMEEPIVSASIVAPVAQGAPAPHVDSGETSIDDEPPPVPKTDLPPEEEEALDVSEGHVVRVERTVVKTVSHTINDEAPVVQQTITKTITSNVSNAAAPVAAMAEIEDIDDIETEDENSINKSRSQDDTENNNPDDNADKHNTTGGSDVNENTVKTTHDDDNANVETNLDDEEDTNVVNLSNGTTPNKSSTETTI